jgi:PKD repeat protein
LSGLAGCSAPIILSAEGAAQSPSGTCTDNAGNSSVLKASGINIDKTSPVPLHSGPFSVNEGSNVTLGGTASTDALSGIFSTNWALDGDSVFDDPDPAIFNGIDDSINAVSLKVVDKAGNEAIASTQVTVNNVAPTINSLTAPLDPVSIGAQPINLGVAFGDPGTVDTHNVVIDWGDGNIQTLANQTTPVSPSHTYNSAGVYKVDVTVTDDDGDSDVRTFEYIVVYDPKGGFVTGGGWITSPPGACQFPACTYDTRL